MYLHIHLIKVFISTRDQLVNLGLLVLQEKRVLVVYVGTTEHLENKESEDHLDHLVAQETRGTLGKMEPL